MQFCLYLIAVIVLLVLPCSSAGLTQGAKKGAALTARVVAVTKADPRSGQLVTTIVITPKVAAAAPLAERAPSAEVKNLMESAAKNYDVSPALVDSVIQVESNYNQFAVSPKGAQGLMQLMPATARRFGVKDIFDPKQNIEGGVRYLKFLQETFKDDRLAIAAYNAGEGAVVRYGTVPPYPETVDYVAKIGKKIGQTRQAKTAKPAGEQKPEPAPEAPEYRRLAKLIGADGRVYLTTQ
jgi:soluble lytic murein transglycosylase-like protein